MELFANHRNGFPDESNRQNTVGYTDFWYLGMLRRQILLQPIFNTYLRRHTKMTSSGTQFWTAKLLTQIFSNSIGCAALISPCGHGNIHQQLTYTSQSIPSSY